ncbi:BNR-4 repeat-containing protein [Coraliomargarita sp. W4R53]
MKYPHLISAALFALSTTIVSAAPIPEEPSELPTPRLISKQKIDEVWTGHSVGFGLTTAAPYQYVLYYDTNRQASIAQRKLGSTEWNYAKIDTFVEWDSHNTLHLAVDRDGYLHFSGNMHVVPLIYFRSTRPHDITEFKRAPMVGELEERTTYPRFFKNKDGDLIFSYRDGHSGNGINLYNIYDEKTKTWSRLLDTPLADGEGKMNAYILGPKLGPDGYFHASWVWRDTIHAETNHDLSYARSIDLINWETIDGTPIKLPMTIETPGLIVDPIPSGGGILNGSGKVGFDSQNRVVITYHKFDEEGNTQIYNARWETNEWVFYQSTDWDYRWDFKGGGSITRDLRHDVVTPADEGELALPITHNKYENGRYILDEKDFSILRIEGATDAERAMAREIYTVKSDFPEMQRLKASDSGKSPEPNIKYELKWEALKNFRDAPRPKPWPASEPLWLYTIQTAN